MFSWAIDNDLAETNPTAKIKLLYSGDGFHTWTVPEVRQYEAEHPAGSRARLAMHLALYTGLRLNSLAIVGRQHFRDGQLTIRPEKTKKSSGVVIDIPVLAELQKTIDESETGNLTSLITEFGKPFATNGLGNKMRDWCDQAGLFHCTTHGLRKADATIAAENGATDEELMAIFGWTTKSQTTVYTKKKPAAKDRSRRNSEANPGTKLAQICPTLSEVEKRGAKRPKIHNENNDDLREWCPMPESNQHFFRNSILSRARLPIPPMGQRIRTGGCLTCERPDAQDGQAKLSD